MNHHLILTSASTNL